MDDTTRKMVSEAYDETAAEAVARGQPFDVAHREGLTAAAMFLSSLVGLEDGAARIEVETLGLSLE